MKHAAFRTLSLFTAIFMAVQIIGMIPFKFNTKLKVKADEYSSQPDRTKQQINILEIEPNIWGYVFNENSFKGKFGDSQVNLTQMPIKEFIANIQTVLGKYDIIYIGKNGGNYTKIGDMACSLPYGGDSRYGNYAEFYSDNDITNKKAAEIIDYINAGQCTVFEQGVFDAAGTKLYNNFVKYKNDPNLKSNVKVTNDFEDIKSENKNSPVDSLANSLADSLVNFYNSCTKRPQLCINSAPTEYEGDFNNDKSYQQDRNLNYNFSVDDVNNPGGPITAKLYFDTNDDGLFKDDKGKDDDEVKVSQDLNAGSNLSISYTVPNYFSGILPWKLEITDNETGAKSYQTGNMVFKAKTVKQIRVLQIWPYGCTFFVGNYENGWPVDKNFQMTAPLKLNGLYDIKVTSINVDDFNNSYAVSKDDPPDVKGEVVYTDSDGNTHDEPNVTVPTKLNGNYDMVILGFSDCYGHKDINDNGCAAIKDFINTKQSVMFTHDTSTYDVHKPGSWGYNLTKNFRDIIGMNRYALDSMNRYIHDSMPLPYKWTYGITDPQLNNANTGGDPHWTTTTAHKVNDGVTTEFPYKLPDDITVSETHFQYFQLDLEDPDVVPWYSLDYDSRYGGMAKYDPRNFYYMYSKGNVTYSGTGHTSPGGQEQEDQLFVNTILKAAKSANHAPTLYVHNLEDGETVASSQNLKFSFTANDEDNDKMTGTVYINDKPYKLYNKDNNNIISSGDTEDVTIPSDDLAKHVGNSNTFTIKVEVEDPYGAEASSKEYTLNYEDVPSITLNSEDNNYGCLKGDILNVTLSVDAAASKNGYKTETSNMSFPDSNNPDIETNDDNTSKSGLTISGDDTWDLKNVTFSPDPDYPSQKKTFHFKADSCGSYNVTAGIEYKFNDLYNGKTQKTSKTFYVNVADGSINVQVKKIDKGGTKDNASKLSDSRAKTCYIGIYKKSDNTFVVGSKVSQDDGTVSFKDITSGDYIVKLSNPPDNYACMDENAAAPVSYANNNGACNVSMYVTDVRPDAPSLSEDITTYTNKPIKVSIDNVQDASKGYMYQIKSNKTKDWQNYSEPVSVDTEGTTVSARCGIIVPEENEIKDNTIWSNLAQLTVYNYDDTPPDGDIKFDQNAGNVNVTTTARFTLNTAYCGSDGKPISDTVNCSGNPGGNVTIEKVTVDGKDVDSKNYTFTKNTDGVYEVDVPKVSPGQYVTFDIIDEAGNENKITKECDSTNIDRER